MISSRSRGLGLATVLALVATLTVIGAIGASAANASKPKVSTIAGFEAPGTPAKFNEVRNVSTDRRRPRRSSCSTPAPRPAAPSSVRSRSR